LKRAAETAKIDLSRSDRAVLETCRFEDEAGREIEFEAELKREHIERVAEPIIRRSVEICKRVLREKNLDPKAIEKVILVGGPTLPKFALQRLHDTKCLIKLAGHCFCNKEKSASPRTTPSHW